MDLIRPDWPAPSRVRALFTTRDGGVSQGPYAGLNLGTHVGDAPAAVAENRRRLVASEGLPGQPLWLEQVHGTEVVVASDLPACPPRADAAVTRQPGLVLSVMTADCLPVLLCDIGGQVIATAHAGWRGLCDGVLEQAVAAMQLEPQRLLAWLGPAIGPLAFEVGPEVRAAFLAKDPAADSAFVARGDKYLANLYQLARQRLRACGLSAIYGGDDCTFSQPARFYSYRRDGQTGRMAGLIWLADD